MNELRRPIQNRMLAGVCVCLANRMGIDPSIFRIAYVLLSLFTVGFPGILLYIIMWIIIPDERPSDNYNNNLNR
ncbi:MAG: PspC domain-containing protein [Marinifilaceae bacterium]|nr:PspC domain-containing protein [Marinifilaceae bacterium]